MAEAYLNGKPGKWRTVGGRRIFIAEGQSLKDAMWESGKFDKLDIANRDKIASKRALKEDEKEDQSSRELKPLSSYLEENGIDRDSLSKEQYNSYLKEYRRNGEIKSLKDQKPTKLSTDRYLERGEMMDVVDKWSIKGFDEEGAFGNDGYGKGVLHERFASGQLEGFGGEADDFVIKGLDMGSVDQKIALNELNKELNKKGYEASYLKEIDSTVHQDIQIKKIKSDDVGKAIAKKLPYENPAREKAEALKNDYVKYNNEYKKYADLASQAQYGSEDYKKYAAKRSAAYSKAQELKTEALTEFNKTIPYDEMFDAAKQISGSKNAQFGKVELINRNGQLYPKFQSNDIKDDAGIFGSVLKGAKLENFNSELYIDDKGELSYWGTMSLRYQHNGGGTNGMELMNYRYNSKTGWDIADSAGYKYKNGKKITTVSGLADYYMEYYGYSKADANAIAKARMDELKRRDSDIDF